MATGMQNTEITGLTIYPVKSMKGIPLKSAVLTPQGLEHDRHFMVVRSNGRFLTQRDLPRLVLVRTSLDQDGVVLSLDGHGSVTLPRLAADGERIHTRVWGDECETVDQGEELSAWLTDALQSTGVLRLVRMAPDFIRPQGKPEHLGERTNTLFADAAPFLVTNEASLSVLNRELEARGHGPVPMNRFRPNIVVQGMAPFAEHQVAKLESQNYSLKFCHPCERCVVTTIDQATAEKNPDWQPFKTLREINPVPGGKPAPAFGQNAILENGDQAIIALGDRLAVNSSKAVHIW
jgi:uncharacterized protein YcbX